MKSPWSRLFNKVKRAKTEKTRKEKKPKKDKKPKKEKKKKNDTVIKPRYICTEEWVW